MQLKKILVPILGGALISLCTNLKAEDAPKKSWKSDTEFSFVSTNGNSKAQTTSGKEVFTNKWSRSSLEVIAGGMGSQDDGQSTAEKYYANEKMTFTLLKERNYVFEKFGWDKDRFAGVDNRYDGSVGLGREIIKKANDNLFMELGGGYIAEERVHAQANNFVSGRAYGKYTRTLSATSKFSQDAEYLHNFENPADFRVNTETALTAVITTHFLLKVSYKWAYVGEPPAGFGRNDTTTSVALVASY